ncbi:MAG TPA: DUF1565 domain-containing protein, partial [Chloroflexi bacterium]|nr:DUF1565 domain-containing protein [Chloroflexota bacterium]
MINRMVSRLGLVIFTAIILLILALSGLSSGSLEAAYSKLQFANHRLQSILSRESLHPEGLHNSRLASLHSTPLRSHPAPIPKEQARPTSQGGSSCPQGSSVITVCVTCACKDVQEAVDAVAEGGTVKVAQGVYTDTDGNGYVLIITKTLTLQGGYTSTGPLSWAVSLPEVYPTILDGNGQAKVISIASGISPIIEGFHIRNGSAGNGAGIYIGG